MRPGSVQFLREIAVSLVPRAIGRGVAQGEDAAQGSAGDEEQNWEVELQDIIEI